MKKGAKSKQIAVRFDLQAYERINEIAALEHRGLGEFVRHAVLVYVERIEDQGRHSGKEKGYRR